MLYDAMLARALAREVFNFGFAGVGTMELAVAAFLCDIPRGRVAAFVVDCVPDMDAETVANRTRPLVAALRACSHATTPIVLAEGTPQPYTWFRGARAHDARNAALREQYDALVADGDAHLHYVAERDLFGGAPWDRDDTDENPTVGGTHPSDLGEYDMALFYEGFLGQLLDGAA